VRRDRAVGRRHLRVARGGRPGDRVLAGLTVPLPAAGPLLRQLVVRHPGTDGAGTLGRLVGLDEEVDRPVPEPRLLVDPTGGAVGPEAHAGEDERRVGGDGRTHGRGGPGGARTGRGGARTGRGGAHTGRGGRGGR